MAAEHPFGPAARPRIDDAPPLVAIRPRPLALPAMLLAATALGGVVFWQMSQARENAGRPRLPDMVSEAQEPGGARGDAPFVMPPDPTPVLQREPMFQNVSTPDPAGDRPAGGLGLGLAPTDPNDPRVKSPALVVDLSEQSATTAAASELGGTPNASAAMVAGAVGGGAAATAGGGARAGADERFAAEIRGDTGRMRVEKLANPSATVIEGTVMAAVLETAVNSDVPGLARAVITRDVRSFDGERVLIPRGSRVIGQYKSGVALGQSRAFVIWNRLIRPDGASVDIASPGTDAMGGGGLKGRVDRHFLQRFGGSILLSLISAGAAAVADRDTQVIIAGARGGADAASVALQKEIDVPPTIHVAQGASIRIFVARDLDFSGVESAP